MMRTSELLALLLGLSAMACVCLACKEVVCGSLVSKCQLIGSCECDMSDKKNCSCCMKCQLCLANLYTQCCSCVGMCNKPDPEESILKTSTIEDLTDTIPELFNVLTEEEDHLHRWSTYKYPVYYDTLYSKHANQNRGSHKTGEERSMSQIDTTGLYNCTVAFMSKCMNNRRCRQSCKSMGAAKYRWFHEGCCQCVGNTCMDYGLNEPMCLDCKSAEEEAELEAELEKEEAGREEVAKAKQEVADMEKDLHKFEAQLEEAVTEN